VRTDNDSNTSDRDDIGTFDGRGGWFQSSSTPTFTYTFKGGKYGIGGEKTSVHAVMPQEETEAFLKANEKSTVVNRPGNPVIKIDENVLPSKMACEDRHVVDIVSRADIEALLGPHTGSTSIWDDWSRMKVAPGEAGDGRDDLLFVSVFDGHMGSPAVADLLQKTLHTCLAWMMASKAHCRDVEHLGHGIDEVEKAMRDA
jgi:pyruvate dehydrogenase phosphatase